MKYILYIIFFFFYFNVQAQTTAPKELEHQTEEEINYKEMFSVAKETITEAIEDNEKVSQYKWYKELLPFKYKVLLYKWMKKNYPKLDITMEREKEVYYLRSELKKARKENDIVTVKVIINRLKSINPFSNPLFYKINNIKFIDKEKY